MPKKADGEEALADKILKEFKLSSHPIFEEISATKFFTIRDHLQGWKVKVGWTLFTFK